MRLTDLLAAAAATAVALVASHAFAAGGILPGYWESRNNATFIVKTPEKIERRCIKAEQVDAYLSGPSTSHYKCKYSTRTIGEGTAHFRGQCVDKHGNAFDVEIRGAYAPEHFTMSAEFKPVALPIGGTATTEAHRISADCPAK